MATKETWAKLKYFKPDSKIDQWGDPYAMDDDLLLMLDDWRRFIATPVYVTSGNQGLHSKDSYHYIRNGSRAVDVIIPAWDSSPIDLLFSVFRFPFTGVGFYPHWRYNGNPAFGLHLDNRPLKWESDFTKNYQESRWMGVKGKDGKQRYLALTLHNLLKHTTGGDYGDGNGNMGLH